MGISRQGLKWGAAALTVATMGVAAPAASADFYKCKRGAQLGGKDGLSFHRTEQIQRNENRTGRKQQATFTSKHTRTVRSQVSAGVEVSTDALFVQAKAHYDVSIEKSTTAETGNSHTVTIPPHRAAIARFGVYFQDFHGAIFSKSGKGPKASPHCKYRLKSLFRVSFPLDDAGWVVSYGKNSRG